METRGLNMLKYVWRHFLSSLVFFQIILFYLSTQSEFKIITYPYSKAVFFCRFSTSDEKKMKHMFSWFKEIVEQK